MILVDTSVWIDFFVGQQCSHVNYLIKQIENNTNICLCGPVLTEILQGIPSEKEYKTVKSLLGTLIYLPSNSSTYLLAADIYRKLRMRGITVRKTIDCIIAAIAIEHGVKLLHNDKDFIPIAKWCKLNIATI